MTNQSEGLFSVQNSIYKVVYDKDTELFLQSNKCCGFLPSIDVCCSMFWWINEMLLHFGHRILSLYPGIVNKSVLIDYTLETLVDNFSSETFNRLIPYHFLKFRTHLLLGSKISSTPFGKRSRKSSLRTSIETSATYFSVCLPSGLWSNSAYNQG